MNFHDDVFLKVDLLQNKAISYFSGSLDNELKMKVIFGRLLIESIRNFDLPWLEDLCDLS